MILLPVAAIILITVLPGIFRSGARAGSLGTLLGVLIPLGIIALVLWVIFYAPVVAAGKRAQGEVFVSPKGVLINDRYYSWMTFGGSSTLRVSYEAGDPPIIQFRWIVGAGRSAKYKRVRVPVPRSHEQEVQPLLAHFSS